MYFLRLFIARTIYIVYILQCLYCIYVFVENMIGCCVSEFLYPQCNVWPEYVYCCFRTPLFTSNIITCLFHGR